MFAIMWKAEEVEIETDNEDESSVLGMK